MQFSYSGFYQDRRMRHDMFSESRRQRMKCSARLQLLRLQQFMTIESELSTLLASSIRTISAPHPPYAGSLAYLDALKYVITAPVDRGLNAVSLILTGRIDRHEMFWRRLSEISSRGYNPLCSALLEILPTQSGSQATDCYRSTGSFPFSRNSCCRKCRPQWKLSR
jgi:hypothetical protein